MTGVSISGSGRASGRNPRRFTAFQRTEEALENHASLLVAKEPVRDSWKYPVWIREVQAHLWRINQHQNGEQ